MAGSQVENSLGAAAIMSRFGAIAMALIACQLDYFALSLALPSMADELGVTATDLQWAVSGYMIAIGIAMVPGSRVADLIGRKKVMLFGLTIFGLASLWVGLSTTANMVVFARLAQGLGAGIYFPVAFAIVANSTNDVERPKILGFLTGLAGVGTALGPVLGGGLSSTVGWRWVFFINVPVALVGVVWGHFQLEEQKDPDLSDKRLVDLDWLGVVLIALGVAGLSIGIDDSSIEGLLNPVTYVPAIIGMLAVVVFIIWEFRAKWALIPPAIWRNVQFTALVVAATIANMGVVVMIFVSTLYLQEVRDYSGLVAGLMFIPAAFGLAIGGPVSGRLASRVPSQRVMTVAMVVGALSLVAMAFAQNIVVVLILMGVSGFLLGLGFQFGNVAVQSVVPGAQAGTAAGIILTMMVTLGGVAVVVASATIEAVGDGFPTQAATEATLLSWAAITGVLGIIFGLSQWRNAKIAAPSQAVVV